MRNFFTKLFDYLHLGFARKVIIDNFTKGWITRDIMLEQLYDLEEELKDKVVE